MGARWLQSPVRVAVVAAALASPITALVCGGLFAARSILAPDGLRPGLAAGLAASATVALTSLAAWGLAHLLKRTVIDPLEALTIAVEQASTAGRDEKHAPFEAPAGELGRLADAFNTLRSLHAASLYETVAALTEARDAAQAASLSKSQFLANMSHEIRTPLNGVVGVIDALSRTRLSANQRDMVELVRTSGQTLERLLSDVLDISRMESGQIQMEARAFDLADAAHAVGALMSLRAEEKGVQFLLELEIAAPTWVTGDEVRIKQILSNLVSNAIKFTEKGRVRLTVSAESKGFRFTVSDTGVGFDASQKETIFRRFQQADSSITRRFGGTGLGLAISAELARLMGGELDCFSVPGRGSRFWLTVPLAPAEEPGPALALVESAVEPMERRLRILLADDHPVNRRVVELILDGASVDLVQVEDGAAAVEAFSAGGFDLVLMDMQMPVMDGLTATRAIREHERSHSLPRTPIVMLTANAGQDHVKAGVEAGADGHLTKPVTAQAIFAVVESAAAAWAAEEPDARPEPDAGRAERARGGLAG